MMERLICSVSGIRGKVGKALTFSEAYRITRIYYDVYLKRIPPVRQRKMNIVLSRDDKASGEGLVPGVLLAAKEISAAGGREINVIYLGLASTPATEWAVKHYGTAGGINITASHNPVEWNGIKLFGNDGILLREKQMREIGRRLEMKSGPRAPAKNVPPHSPPAKKYLEQFCVHVRAGVSRALDRVTGAKGGGRRILDKIRKSNFRIVIDACSGKSAETPVRFLLKLGIKKKNITVINNGTIENSGRSLEPAPQNLENLRKAIAGKKADIGFAFDPDQDRLVIMPLKTEELTPLLCGKFLMELQAGNPSKPMKQIPVNLSSTSAWEETAERHGIDIIRTKIGEINVIEAMFDHGSMFGAEGNGGVILSDVNYGRNSATGMALILSYLAWSGKTLAELEKEIPGYVLIKEKIPVLATPENMKSTVRRLGLRGSKLDTRDGCKVIFKDRSWVQLRPSNTEPITRIFAEAKIEVSEESTRKRLGAIIKTVSYALERRKNA